MTLRLKTMTQINDQILDRNTTILRLFLEGKSYQETGQLAGVTSATVQSNITRLAYVLSVYAEEMGFAHPYSREKYPTLWRERFVGNEVQCRPSFAAMTAPNLRREAPYWLHLIESYLKWKKTPLKVEIIKPSTQVIYLNLSVMAFRNLRAAFQHVGITHEPLVSDAINIMRDYPIWSTRCQMNVGIGRKGHYEIKTELERHGFSVDIPTTVSDTKLLRQTLEYIHGGRAFSRADKAALIQRLVDRLS